MEVGGGGGRGLQGATHRLEVLGANRDQGGGGFLLTDGGEALDVRKHDAQGLTVGLRPRTSCILQKKMVQRTAVNLISSRKSNTKEVLGMEGGLDDGLGGGGVLKGLEGWEAFLWQVLHRWKLE